MSYYNQSMQSTQSSFEPRGTEVSQQAYSVCVYHNGYYLMNSNVYNSPEDAKVFMDYCKNMDYSKLEYQMYTHTSTGIMMTPSKSTTKSTSTSTSPKTDEVDLSGMTLEKYGKGFLLRPYENCEFHGLKYFLNGFWIKRHESWFFKTEYFDDLIMYGAEYISDSLVEDYNSSQDEDYVEEVIEDTEDELEYTSGEDSFDYEELLKGVRFVKYGRGYIVYPEETHEMYGEKYMGNGWWNSKAKGWFFKKEFYDELIEAGAVEDAWGDSEDTELVQTPEVLVVEDLELGKMGKWEKYGKGFLFTPQKTHPQYEQKSYSGGWWMPTQKSWFFRKSIGSKLVPKNLL